MFIKKKFQNKSVHPGCIAEESPARFAAILWASEEGYADVVKSLITPVDIGNDEHHSESGEKKPPVETDQPSTTLKDTCAAALVKAADRGHVDVVRVFLSHGIQESVIGHCGWIALMIAAKKGHVDVFCNLMEADAGRAVVPESSWISMQFVSKSDDSGLLAALAEQALMRDLDVVASARVVAWAAQNGLLHAVQSLLASEKKMDTKKNAVDAMEWAVKTGRVEVINQLVNAGVGPKSPDEWTRLSVLGFQNGHPDVMKTLLQYKNGKKEQNFTFVYQDCPEEIEA